MYLMWPSQAGDKAGILWKGRAQDNVGVSITASIMICDSKCQIAIVYWKDMRK